MLIRTYLISAHLGVDSLGKISGLLDLRVKLDLISLSLLGDPWRASPSPRSYPEPPGDRLPDSLWQYDGAANASCIVLDGVARAQTADRRQQNAVYLIVRSVESCRDDFSVGIDADRKK